VAKAPSLNNALLAFLAGAEDEIAGEAEAVPWKHDVWRRLFNGQAGRLSQCYLDLRSCSGCFLKECLQASSLFLGDDPIREDLLHPLPNDVSRPLFQDLLMLFQPSGQVADFVLAQIVVSHEPPAESEEVIHGAVEAGWPPLIGDLHLVNSSKRLEVADFGNQVW
jgi:hypothetical protein